MELSIMFFSSGEDGGTNGRYHYVIQAAQFADQNNFKRIWLPERHFIPFGALYPNPAVLAAALACETKRIRIAAGSVVAPLHDPLRITEEWSVADNLSNGRVDLSFASGWHPDDFAFSPELYTGRHQSMREKIKEVQLLWTGKQVQRISGTGDIVNIRIYPTPVQKQLPIWITAARNKETFRYAGESGFNVLTYLVDFGPEELQEAINIYKEARRNAGWDPQTGEITVMLHTQIFDDRNEALEKCGTSYKNYFTANNSLLFAAGKAIGRKLDPKQISSQSINDLISYQFERVFEKLSLMGTPASALELIDQLKAIGVTEIACLVDFVETGELMMESLEKLNHIYTLLQEKNSNLKKQNNSRISTLKNLPQHKLFTHTTSGKDFYEYINSNDVAYGPDMQLINTIQFDEHEAVSHLVSPAEQPIEEAIILDNSFITLLAVLMNPHEKALGNIPSLPMGVERLEYLGPVKLPLWSHAKKEPSEDQQEIKGSVTVFNDKGEIVLLVKGLRYRTRNNSAIPLNKLLQLTHDLKWTRQDKFKTFSNDTNKSYILLSSNPSLIEAIALQQNLTERISPLQFNIPASNEPADFAKLFLELFRERLNHATPELNIICDLSGCPPEDKLTSAIYQDFEKMCGVLLGLSQCIENNKYPNQNIELILLTEKAQRTDEKELVNVAAAGIWGLAKSLSRELSNVSMKLLDLDGFINKTDILSQLLETDTEPESAIRGNYFYTPLLSGPSLSVGDSLKQPSWKPESTKSYMISGGTGGVASYIITWLIANGAKHIITIQRSSSLSNNYNDYPDVIFYHIHSDVTDEQNINTQLQILLSNGLPAIDGIFHLAGINMDQSFLKVNSASLKQVIGPKLFGSENLFKLAKLHKPDFFIVFSSIAAFIGSPGQTAYAAANAMAQAFVNNLVAQETRTKCILWGPWPAGMVSGKAMHERFEKAGLKILDIPSSLRILSTFLLDPSSSIVVADFIKNPLAIQDRVLNSNAGTEIAKELQTLSKSELEEIILEFDENKKIVLVEHLIKKVIREVMGSDDLDLPLNASLTASGIDSLAAMQVRSEFGDRFGINIPVTIFLEAGSLHTLAHKLLPLLLSTTTIDNPDQVINNTEKIITIEL